MKFSRLIRESKLFWPKEIDISDGEIIKKGSARFPTLSEVRERAAENQCLINEWHGLFNWCVFVGYHSAARHKIERGEADIVRLSEIDWDLVESHLLETLNSTENWWPRRFKRQFQRSRTS